MHAFFASLTSAHTVLLMLSFFGLAGIFVAVTLIEGWIGQGIVVGASVLVLVFGVKATSSSEGNRYRSIRYSVFVFAGLITLLVAGQPLLDSLVLAVLKSISPLLAETVREQHPDAPIAFSLVIVFLMHAVTLMVLRNPVPLGRIERDPKINEARYRERRAAFVRVLESHLGRVDEDLRWHHHDFVRLRAQVDVRNGNRRFRRVVDLVEAIKENGDANIFVVIGVPGAGKSVALRRSCVDLLANQRPNERIPIYVNLKEWASERKWSAEKPPTHEEFSNFVHHNLRDRLPDRSRAFFEEHFNHLRENGEIFFMFDSFDEIPGILDSDETSQLLDAVSGLVVAFLRSTANSRGVIASRYFRRPRLGQESHVELAVRPFAERQIADVLRLSASKSKELERILFIDRPELGVIARNPFALSLILLYWESNAHAPPSQSALYAAYIERSLADATELIAALGLDAEHLKVTMADISWAMFESDSLGLEISLQKLRLTLDHVDIDAAIDSLVAARLVRKAPRSQAVSFVHRRFNEYFLVSRWLSGERVPPFDAIPTDSRYRDALVLYAEVATDADAAALALSCWQEIQPLGQTILNKEGGVRQLLRAIYSLRFLTEAFRARPCPVLVFRDAMGEKVHNVLASSDDLLLQKIAVEAVGLLAPVDAERTLVAALKTESTWIQETAFSSSRFLSALPDTVVRALTDILVKRSLLSILVPDRDFKYLLTISDVFEPVYRNFRAARADTTISIFAAIALIVFLGVNWNWFIAVGVLFAIFEMSIGFALFPPRKVLRVELALGSVVSPIRTLSEFLLGGIRSLPLLLVVTLVVFHLYWFTFTAISSLPQDLLSLLARFGLNFSALNPQDVVNRLHTWFSLNPIRTIIFIVLCVSSLPIFLGPEMLNRFSAHWIAIRPRRLFLLFIGSLLCLLFITGVLLALIISFNIWPDITNYIFLGFMAFSFGTVIVLGVLRLYNSLRRRLGDRSRLAASTVKFSGRRSDIAEALASFETVRAREHYIDWVEREAAAQDKLTILAAIVSNPWPSVGRPNWDNDASSTRLAQLDEQWLKLNV